MSRKMQEIAENPKKWEIKRQYPRKIAGIFTISCLKTRKIYLARSKDVELSIWTIKSKLRRGVWHSPSMQEDYEQYGLRWFRFGLVAGEEILESTDMAALWEKIHRKWLDMLADMKPAYNVDRVRTRRFLRRKALVDLGTGKPTGKEIFAHPLKCWGTRGVYVVTCKKNKRSFVGMTTSFHETIKQVFRALAAGTMKNGAMQRDYSVYGEAAFLVEYCEMPEATDKELAAARKEIARRLGAFYNEDAERQRREKISAKNKEYHNVNQSNH